MIWFLGAVATAATPTATSVIAASVKAHGLDAPSSLHISFGFRGTPYRLTLRGRHSVYERTVTPDDGTLRVDRLDGADFTSMVQGAPVALESSVADARRRSLNSVGYFALLPRPLQDDAVVATLAGVTTLRGRELDTIDVRFHEEGGGDDHDDVFRYWFDPDTHRLAYLAYTFSRGEGGVRVREVTRHHESSGVVLPDWANYGRNGQGLTIDAAMEEFEAGTLPQVSTIELEAVKVERVPVPAP